MFGSRGGAPPAPTRGGFGGGRGGGPPGMGGGVLLNIAILYLDPPAFVELVNHLHLMS